MSAPPRPHPELMILGDSLAQGCRSLSVTRDYCAQSWAARLARTQDWEFITPDMPWPILFDLEQEIRRLNILSAPLALITFADIIQRLVGNQRSWFNSTPSDSQQPCFDNLGLSGALVCDLYRRTSASSFEEILDLTNAEAGKPTPLLDPGKIGDLHLAINGWFTLNPGRNEEWKDYTPLKWAEVREPKRLVIQVGHNHGLFQFGFEAKEQGTPETGFTQPGTSPFKQQPDGFWKQWEDLAEGLAALPKSIGTILVVLLPKIGGVASLEPRSDKRLGGYADFYEPAFVPSPNVLSREQVEAADKAIRNILNPRIKQIITDAAVAAGTEKRVKFLDAWTVFDRDDYKNSLQTGRRIRVDANQLVDNRYLQGAPPFLNLPILPHNRLVAGGFQSVDGMHPTGVGYAVIAAAALQELGLNGNISELLQRAFDEDKLLSQYPPELDYLVWTLRILRAAQHANDFVQVQPHQLSGDSHVVDLLNAMMAVFHP